MVKKNLVANFLGQGWTALMGLAFIPVYIKYLGIEAYGLIGLFTMVQAWLTLLDAGMTPALGREMARFTGGAISAQQLRDLLRSIEVLTFALVAAVSLVAILSCSWVAAHWLKPQNISLGTVSQACAIMGIVAALKLAENIYRSSLMGLQRQVLFNIVNSTMATIRAVGSVAILTLVSNTIQAFFLWQGLASLASLLALALTTYKVIPRIGCRAKFSLEALREVWQFAGGMMGITFLSLLLMQVDKLLLSKIITLEEYGYYTLAAIVAGGLFSLISPIAQAFYPKFCELHSQKNIQSLTDMYHKSAQIVTAVGGSSAIVLVVFSEALLRLWTQDSELAQRAAPLLSLLVFGNLINGLMWIPYQTQLAYGWTSLTLGINTFAVLLIIPALLLVVPRYGAVGAAWVWCALNLCYVFLGVNLMYRRILTAERWRWYSQDVFMPLCAATLGVLGLSALWPYHKTGIFPDLTLLASAMGVSMSLALFFSSILRRQFIQWLRLLSTN